jgi:hypothetical protein
MRPRSWPRFLAPPVRLARRSHLSWALWRHQIQLIRQLIPAVKRGDSAATRLAPT